MATWKLAVATALACSATVVLLSACGEDDDEFTDCTIGSLPGTWQTHYDLEGGNCGPVPDQTGLVGPDVPVRCTIQSQTISEDRCRIDYSYSCPMPDGQGTQTWTILLKQTSERKLEGKGSVQVNHPVQGTCQGSYDMTVTRL